MSKQKYDYTKKLTDKEEEKLQKKYGKFKFTIKGNQYTHYENVADAIIGEFGEFIAIEGDKETTPQEMKVLYYKDGYYREGGKTLIEKYINMFFPTGSNYGVKNILRLVLLKLHDKMQPFEEYEPPLHLINFKNGFYSLKSKKLLPHQSCVTFTSQIPYNYDKDATCPRFKQFLKEVLQEEDIPKMQEWLGYNLYRGYFKHNWALFVGTGNNGKTVLMNVMRGILGKDNISEQDLKDISKRFGGYYLWRKYANFGGEVDLKGVDWNLIKKYSGADGFTEAERKGEMKFLFRNFAKLTCSTNHYRTPSDVSKGNLRRILLFRFENSFEGKQEDTKLQQKLDNETQGIINFAIEGLERLLKDRKFTNQPENTDDIFQEMELLEDSITEFFDEHIKPTEKENSVFVKDMYKKYKQIYTKDAESLSVFAKKFKELIEAKQGKSVFFNDCRKGRKRDSKGKSKTCWWHVELK